MVITGEAILTLMMGAVVPTVLLLWKRRDRRNSEINCQIDSLSRISAELKPTTDRSVDNIKELWEKRDELHKYIARLGERIAYLEGLHRMHNDSGRDIDGAN